MIHAKFAARAKHGFPIVGVGASAGGLEAFTQLLKQLPADTGFGFVFVQHLDPQHESALTQILARATAMPVCEVTNNLRVEPNRVYIIPPNASLGLALGVLKLRPRARTRAPIRSIDFFFESLAQDQRERAIGVILSGTATDGTLGLEAIKAEGGITFAQDDSARYDSMPRSAIGAGCVDFVLSPEAIARELARIAKHPYVVGRAPEPFASAEAKPGADAPDGETPPPSRGGGRIAAKAGGGSEQNGYKKILLHLRNHSGVDFSLYKPATIHRRITRRTVLSKQPTLAGYADFLRGNPRELDALYSDALISVTSFFRNAEAFEVLQRKVFPKLLRQRDDGPARVWVLGCSTGQEAYSIAMGFAESADKVSRPRKLQVFATDLNEANLEKARHGLYAKSVAQDVSPERLRRFFTEEEGGYRIIKQLREHVVFARQNLISDPPFSRMDLISCRNLMIYLEPSLQAKALPTFHYALKPEGFLFLGASESIGSFTDRFEPVDKKQKIYSKKAMSGLAFQLPVRQPRGVRSKAGQTPRAAPPIVAPGGQQDAFRGELNAQREADRVTVNQFAPPGVLINADLQILQFRGLTDAYLAPPAGKASFDVLKMARDGLRLPLRAAINRARKENGTARQENVPVQRHDGVTRKVNVEVVPLKNLKERCFLILFEDSGKGARPGPGAPPRDQPGGAGRDRVSRKEEAGRIVELERELAETRDYLQSFQEHQEATTEELQASHEEGQSANEELQSLNEELETSKEELESTNEELTTVNEEMANRNIDLSRLNSDLTNLQTSTKLAIVLLARDLAIRRFSAQAKKQFNLMPTDVGRPFGSVRHDLDMPDLEPFVAGLIASVREGEREVRDRQGRWYSLQVRPYITLDNKVDGAVLVLVDINAAKESEQAVVAARNFAEAIIGTARDPLLILDSELRVEKANEAFYATFKVASKEAVGRSIFELDRGQWDDPKLRKLLQDILPRHSFFNNFEITQNLKNAGRRTLLLNARTLSQTSGQSAKILVGIQDVTELLHFQAEMRRSEVRYRRLFEAARDGVLLLDPESRKIVDANPFMTELLGYTHRELLGKELFEIGLLKDEPASLDAFRELRDKGFIRYDDLPLESKAGGRRDVEVVANLYRENGHEVIQCNIRDITDRKRAEATSTRLRATEESYRALFESIDEGFCIIEQVEGAAGDPLDFRYIEANPAFSVQSGLNGAVGKTVRQLVPGEPEEWFLTYEAVCRTGEAIRFERSLRTNGRVLELYAFRVKDETRRRVAVLFKDITARKGAEEALRQAHAQLASRAHRLEHQVARRTAQLTATNRRLEASVSTIGKSKEEYRALFLESELMQEKLRHMARQILTAQEDERREISRDLHDDVVQSLVGINVELATLGKMAPAGNRALKAKIARTQRLLEKSVNAVHQFARELRPPVLDDLGLIPALHAYIKTVAARNKLKIRLTAFAGVEALDNTRRAVLYRVAQEALTNVGRHARASLVNISISELPGAIRMEVRDNGKSFQVPQTLSAKTNKRLGLLGMRERMEMVGGTLLIVSTPGQGTTVRAEIPFNAKRKGK